MKSSGIYSIINTVNGKIYYGSTNDFYHRWATHKYYLTKNKHNNLHLQRAWNKYGKSVFQFKIIEKIPSDKLQEVEQQYLNRIKLMPRDMYYNISEDASSPMRGRKHTVESRKKISLNRIGKYVGNNCNMYGKIGDKHHFYGKHQSETVRKRISESHKDKTIYSFKNIITDEVFTGIRYNFYKKYDLNVSNVCDVIKGKVKSHKNWILV